MSWAAVLEAWMRRFVAGEIRYDPQGVEVRWVPAPAGAPGQFRAILNAGRMDRLAKAA